MQKCERVRSAQFPRGKSNTRSDATPSIDCSKHRLVKWAETLFTKALKSSIQKYFLLCNHAAWWTLAIAGFSMSLGREEAVFFGILWRFFPSQCYQGALYARSIFNGALFVAQKDIDIVVKVSNLKTSHTGNSLQHCAVIFLFGTGNY